MPTFTRKNPAQTTFLSQAVVLRRALLSGSGAAARKPHPGRGLLGLRHMGLGAHALAALALLLSPAIAPAQVSESLSQNVITFANNHLAIYTAAHTLAKSKVHPPAPVPPMFDPPCTQCGSTGTPSDTEQQVTAWVQQAEEPEMDYITQLLDIEKFLQTIESMEENLSPAALSALKPFGDVFAKQRGSDFDQIQQDAFDLAQRLVDKKVKDMFDKYHKEPKQAYAGIKLIVDANSKLSNLNFVGASDSSASALQMAAQWEQTVVSKVQDDVLKGDNYNLCPVYAAMFSDLETLGGRESSQADLAKMQQTLDKIDKFLNFDVVMDLHALSLTAQGEAVMDLTWHMTSKLQIDMNFPKTGNGGPCYQPSFKDNKMNVQVVSWSMHSGGDEVTLASPHNFNVTMSNPTINICDKNPTLAIPFSGGFPDETLDVNGVTKPGQIFAGMLTQVVTANVMTLPSIQKLTGNSTPSPTPVAQSGQDDPQAQINAHKGDLAWIMGPQGQAAIAAIQKQAIGKFSTIAANQPTSAAMMATLQSALLPWTNGTEQTVDKTMQFTKNDKEYMTVTLHTTVQHAPQ